MTPSTRKEMYLNKIATGEGAVPTPATREEMYLAKIAGEEIGVPTPVTRVEVYLYKIGGGEIIVPTPTTRLEMFLAAASGMPVSTPVPATREEILWDYIINGTNPQTITGVPPISFTGNGTPLISWSMKGNGSQHGTPTPDNPVMPTFCGVRTGNLFDKDTAIVYNAYINTAGYWLLSDDSRSVKIRCSPNTQYTLSVSDSLAVFRIYETSDENIVPTNAIQTHGITRNQNVSQFTFTTAADTKCIIFQGSATVVSTWIASLMLNLGSTALPYEPFGYKIPISCAGQTVPVYLGTVQTVRRIKKLVLDGTENWGNYGGGNHFALTFSPTAAGANQFIPICSHFKAIQATSWNDLQDGEMSINPSDRNSLRIYDSRYQSNTTAFKAWLASEYAAGHPVIVWYVLATEQTGIVNEPLCKISTYADELHSEDASVTIPTIKGQNVLTVDTPIQPSEMTITGYIAETQTMAAAKIMARANGMNINDKELESLSKKELNSILKGTVKSDGQSTRSNG